MSRTIAAMSPVSSSGSDGTVAAAPGRLVDEREPRARQAQFERREHPQRELVGPVEILEHGERRDLSGTEQVDDAAEPARASSSSPATSALCSTWVSSSEPSSGASDSVPAAPARRPSQAPRPAPVQSAGPRTGPAAARARTRRTHPRTHGGRESAGDLAGEARLAGPGVADDAQDAAEIVEQAPAAASSSARPTRGGPRRVELPSGDERSHLGHRHERPSPSTTSSGLRPARPGRGARWPLVRPRRDAVARSRHQRARGSSAFRAR